MEVGQCNIRSLKTSTKYIEDLVMKTDIRMLLFTEIWHVDANHNLLSQWRWYKNERADREGGGAAIVVHPSVKSWPRKDLKRDDIESAWCEISIDNKSILVGSIYISDLMTQLQWKPSLNKWPHFTISTVIYY